MIDRFLALDGQPIERTESAWPGLLDGFLGISLLNELEGVATIKLTFPTAAADINDYIWTDEVAAGFTNKVVFRQNNLLPSQRMRSIIRCGSDSRWTCGGPDRYEIEVELVIRSILPDHPLEVAFLWPEYDSGNMKLLGVVSA